jgi:cysteinyl-tRNA synthetase
MHSFSLVNSLSRTQEIFEPREQGHVKVFTCGPSIYRRPHLGNYRSFLYEDTLVRYLEYLGYQVERVINYTDVEDKAISEAEEAGKSVSELTEPIAKRFTDEAQLLRLKIPDYIPRSSTSVDQAVELIKHLMDRGMAYRADHHVFFNAERSRGFGALYGLDPRRWPQTRRRFSKDTYPGKRWNLGDFVLWHGNVDSNQAVWETELGRGRPAWNVQDAAMITKHLGYQVDIACGGIDNIYRHHDYNIAVIEGASGTDYARYWLHGEHLFVDGQKMSKSLGNVVYPETLLDKGYSAEQIRFFLIYGYYRDRLNLTMEDLDESSRLLSALHEKLQALRNGSSAEEPTASAEPVDSMLADFEAAMNDDMHVRRAVDSVIRHVDGLYQKHRDGDIDATTRSAFDAAVKRINAVLQVF